VTSAVDVVTEVVAEVATEVVDEEVRQGVASSRNASSRNALSRNALSRNALSWIEKVSVSLHGVPIVSLPPGTSAGLREMLQKVIAEHVKVDDGVLLKISDIRLYWDMTPDRYWMYIATSLS
jgi:hypothetical protein